MPAPRTGRLNLSAVLSNPHPTIDLHLPADRASLRNFSHAIADFTSRSCAMAEISQRREVYTTETRKLAVRAQDMENETNQCKQKEIELISVLEREREKTKEVESSVAALRLHLASQHEEAATLDAEIEQYRACIVNLRKEREMERKTLTANAELVSGSGCWGWQKEIAESGANWDGNW